jgi:hypothetical protein
MNIFKVQRTKIGEDEERSIKTQSRWLGSEKEVLSPPPFDPLADENLSKVIGAIILPTATGKSFLIKQGLPSHVKEADAICHVRETYLLSDFRDYSKRTGDWSKYDEQLGKHLRERCSDGDIILMASSDLARSMKAVILGTCVLGRQLWENNVLQRGQPIDKYLGCYLQAVDDAPEVDDSYGELYNRVMDLISVWTMYMAGVEHEREMKARMTASKLLEGKETKEKAKYDVRLDVHRTKYYH